MIDTEALAILEAALAHRPPLKGPNSAGRAAAFFDLDGTLSRGHMIFDFPAHLLGAGLFSLEKHREILKVNDDFKAGKLTYRRVAEDLPHFYAEGLKGQEAGNVAIEAERFVDGRMDMVFPYAKGLVRLMRESGRPAIAFALRPR